MSALGQLHYAIGLVQPDEREDDCPEIDQRTPGFVAFDNTPLGIELASDPRGPIGDGVLAVQGVTRPRVQRALDDHPAVAWWREIEI